jgi:plastocyanin
MGRVTKRYVAVCIATALAAAFAAPAPASASVSITIQDDNTFNPRNATQDLGAGSFDWEWGPGGVGTIEEHNVVQDDELFSSGEPVLSRPSGFSVTASAGTYPYYCEIHVGMLGEVSVRPLAADATSGGGVRVTWADASTTTGTRYDVRYRAGKKWKPWKKKTSRVAGTFGRNGKPVKLRKKAKLQARSRAGSARSDWSPTLVLER